MSYCNSHRIFLAGSLGWEAGPAGAMHKRLPAALSPMPACLTQSTHNEYMLVGACAAAGGAC